MKSARALRVREFLNELGLSPVASSVKTPDGRGSVKDRKEVRGLQEEREKTNVKEVGEQKKDRQR